MSLWLALVASRFMRQYSLRNLFCFIYMRVEALVTSGRVVSRPAAGCLALLGLCSEPVMVVTGPPAVVTADEDSR